jgi:hypothetical protein
MTLEEIKREAQHFHAATTDDMRTKVQALKSVGVPFLGCVAFVQVNQNLSLADARKQTLALDVWTSDEKDKIETQHTVMLREFSEDDE